MRIVIKVGTSTLAHSTGRLNIRRIEHLCKVMSDLKNAGHEVIMVSSGAVGAGYARLGLDKYPDTLAKKQACAAVGQSQLMKIYENFFAEYGHTVAQILMTKDVVDNPHRLELVRNTFHTLLQKNMSLCIFLSLKVFSNRLNNRHFSINKSYYISKYADFYQSRKPRKCLALLG